MTTIQIRVDDKTKRAVRRVFHKMGLDLSSGVKLYLARVAQDEAVPFIIRTENGYVPEEESRLIREADTAVRRGTRYATARVALASVLK